MPLLGGLGMGDVGNGNGKFLIEISRINTQCAVSGGRGGDVARHIKRNWKNEAEVVIGMFADEVDSARSAIERRRLRGAKAFAKTRYDFVRNESQSRHPPNTKSMPPHQRLTGTPGSKGAWMLGLISP